MDAGRGPESARRQLRSTDGGPRPITAPVSASLTGGRYRALAAPQQQREFVHGRRLCASGPARFRPAVFRHATSEPPPQPRGEEVRGTTKVRAARLTAPARQRRVQGSARCTPSSTPDRRGGGIARQGWAGLTAAALAGLLPERQPLAGVRVSHPLHGTHARERDSPDRYTPWCRCHGRQRLAERGRIDRAHRRPLGHAIDGSRTDRFNSGICSSLS